jgi:uncharacterized protein
MGIVTIGDVTSALSDEALQLILMPTEQCNFRCVYCYENFRNGAMPKETIDAVRSLLSSRIGDLRYLVISWFGGEPLLALDAIASVSEHIRTLLLSNPDVRYKASITTNGYLLTAATFRRLLDWGVFTYQISFDGPREQHDRKRILADGRPTFDRLWTNLIQMKAVPDRFAVTVRLHVDGDNADQVPAFLSQFAQDFGHDDRFAVYIIELGQYANAPRQDLNLLPSECADRLMQEACSLGQGLHIPVRVAERNNHGFYATCFATKLNSFIIRSNGQVSKCIVALEKDANQVGTIPEDGTLSLDRMKLLAWARGLSSGETQELECPLRGIDSCGSGWLEENGTFVKS